MEDIVKGKRVLVIDTNFIVAFKDSLRNTVGQLSNDFNVFVTQVSIDERIGQKFIEMQNAYNKIQDLEKEYEGIAKISLINNFDIAFSSTKKLWQKTFDEFFCDKVIPLPKGNIFEVVLERAYRKIPPFSRENNASDKGFKDTLMWVSIIEYFKNYNSEQPIIFITNDNSFCKKHEKELKEEFLKITGKTIEIKENSHYKVLLAETISGQLKTEKSNDDKTHLLTEQEKTKLRDEIHTCLYNICKFEALDEYGGQPYEMNYFNISELLTEDEVMQMLETLSEKLNLYIFNKTLSADVIFDGMSKVKSNTDIDVDGLDKLVELYAKIKRQYADLIKPFVATATSLINQNYSKPQETLDDDELPF